MPCIILSKPHHLIPALAGQDKLDITNMLGPFAIHFSSMLVVLATAAPGIVARMRRRAAAKVEDSGSPESAGGGGVRPIIPPSDSVAAASAERTASRCAAKQGWSARAAQPAALKAGGMQSDSGSSELPLGPRANPGGAEVIMTGQLQLILEATEAMGGRLAGIEKANADILARLAWIEAGGGTGRSGRPDLSPL